ncbi:MAG TPA: helix-turn-helix domain-containing protein [Methyloceanibacter sp.]|nr:helix-turn-helix domain-containing protein [Methyloceanibacter sp.]
MRATVPMTGRVVAGGSSTALAITADLLPRAEVARQFDVCQRTLRRWEKSRQGPPVIRVGKRVYYRIESVRRWLLDQEAGPTMP